MNLPYLLLLFAMGLLCCESSQREAPELKATDVLKEGYFNWDMVNADINQSVLVDHMTVDEVKVLMQKMHKADQQYRDSLHHGNKENQKHYFRKMSRNDDANLLLLHQIVKKYGWPGIRNFGQAAAETAWLVVWHHRDNKDVLGEYLPFIGEAVTKSEIPKWHYTSIADQLALLRSIK